ncbi:MAG: glycosyltransferase [Fervidicoccaceae archaeon]
MAKVLGFMFPVSPPQFIEPDDLLRISMVLTYVKYILYIIWVVPLYRGIKTFTSWRTHYAKLVQLPAQLEVSRSGEIPSVAVVIPARNASKYIRASILSAVNQSLIPKTIYVLDDASSDSTVQTVLKLIGEMNGTLISAGSNGMKEFLKYRVSLKSGRELYIEIISFKEHTGKPKMINHVLGEISREHEYMLVLDSDTVIEKKYIEKILSFIGGDKKVAGANGTVLLWKPEGEGRLSWFFAKAFRNISSLYYLLTVRFSETVFKSVNSLNGSCALYRVKPLLEVGGFPDDTYVEDTSISWELQLRGYSVLYLPGAFSYTVDPSSLRRFFSKVFRITVGVQKLLMTRVRRIIANGKKNLFMTSLYTSLGSLPFIFVIMNTIVSAFLTYFGVYGTGGISKYIVNSLQFTPFYIVFAFLYKYPLSYLAISYATGILESYAIYEFLERLYKNEHSIRIPLSAAKKTIVMVPLILWAQAFIALIALPVSFIHAITGKRASKW